MSDQVISADGKRLSFPFYTLLVFAAAAVPALLIVWLVIRYAVPIPMLDDWEMVPLVTKWRTGGLTFHDLFEQQQEARTFFPKLIFIVLAAGKHWDSRIAMMLSILICCLIALGIYRLLSKSGLDRWSRAIVFLFSALLVFSPAQHELWLLASGFPSFMPGLCVVWSFCIMRGQRSIATKFWLCVGLALFASFSLAHGLLSWGLAFPLLLVIEREPQWKRWLGFWILAAAICAGVYFWNFHGQSDLPPFAPRKSLVEYWRYVTAFLGSGLGRSGTANALATSIALGSALVLVYLAGLCRFFWHWRNRARAAEVMPWLALGAYSIASAVLAALGRIEWGVPQALDSRYVAYSLYLAISVFATGALWARDVSIEGQPGKARLAIFSLIAILGTACFAFEVLCATASLRFFPARSAVARLGQSGVLFSQVLDTSGAIKSANYPRPRFVVKNADALDRLRLLRTPLVRTREISKLRRAAAGEGLASGWWDGLTTGSSGARVAWGWAAFPPRKRPADAVVLAYADGRGGWTAFALSDTVVQRPDVAATLGKRDQLWSGWRAAFASDAAPAGAEISAWAVDAREAKLHRLRTNAPMFNR